jgi:hypothetical protein
MLTARCVFHGFLPVVRNNRIAALPADEFADRPHEVQGKAPLDNKAPSSDNSST